MKKDKLFVIRKYVMAPNAQAALKKEKKVKPDDVWVDEEWKKGNVDRLAESIGFPKRK